MQLGPLEYVVIGVESQRFTSDILPALAAIQTPGILRVLDLLFVTKAADGALSMQEIDDLDAGPTDGYGDLAADVLGLFTEEDVHRLADEIPDGSSAAIVLLEHSWARRLSEAARQAGGVLFAGGLIEPSAVQQVCAELETQATPPESSKSGPESPSGSASESESTQASEEACDA